MSDNLAPLQRPLIVTRLLEIKDDIKKRDEKKFADFLGEVENAQNMAHRIHHTCQCTLSYQIANLESSKQAENGSLRLAFDFYAKLQTPGQQLATSNVTYELVRFANETLSFHELAVWMRDFNVVPSLLTKVELRFLWKMTSLQWVRMGKDQIKYLTFDMFQDFFARMAILAYNKPGMKRVILNTNGTMPSPADLVETLCHYMHFDDYGWVKERLNTTGRESVRNHNFRSKGERNEIAKTELREDVRGSRLAQLMTNVEVDEDEEGENGNGDLAGGDDGNGETVEGSDGTSGKTDGNSRPVTPIVRAMRGDGLDQATKIAEALQRKINGLDAGDDNEKSESKSVPGGRLRRKVDSNQFSNMKISPAQEEALLNYDDGLAKLLDKYSLKQTRLGAVEANMESGGAFLDCGRQMVGRILVVSVTVINTTCHEMQVDAIARGFRSDDTKITMLAKSFAPGLKREISVQFTVLDPPGQEAVIAFIDIHAVPVRGSHGEQPVLQSCPVFYRPYRREPPLVDFPIVNVNNLPNLLARYRRESAPQTLATSFEKRGDWYRGALWRDGPALALPEAVGVKHPPKTFAGSLSPTKLLVAMSPETKRKTKKLPPVGSPKSTTQQIILPGVSRGLLRTYEVEEVDKMG